MIERGTPTPNTNLVSVTPLTDWWRGTCYQLVEKKLMGGQLSESFPYFKKLQHLNNLLAAFMERLNQCPAVFSELSLTGQGIIGAKLKRGRDLVSA